MIPLTVPGDKSISHRALMLASVGGGTSRLQGLGGGHDVRTTLALVRRLGADIEERDRGRAGLEVVVRGEGTLAAPEGRLDCANSGTTARLLMGLLAGLGLEATLDGDASLRQRPMGRVVYPLQAMGARIDYLEAADRLPIRLHGRASGGLRSLRHRPRVASAQVKSAILLAGATARVPVTVVEPSPTRDHTERLLRAMGASVRTAPAGTGREVAYVPDETGAPLRPLRLAVPGDPSSAAFLIGAALLLRRPLRVEYVSENPTRTAFLDVLSDMGARIVRTPRETAGAEPAGDWEVAAGARPGAFRVGGDRIPGLIDELPLLAVLAARADGTSEIRDAAELRVKESDRIGLLAHNLAEVGVRVEELPDGLRIHGTDARLEGAVATGGDHRIAMAFGILGVDGNAELSLDDPECAAISFPGFWQALEELEAC